MEPTTTGSYDDWIGRTAVDNTGAKIGKIKDIYYDDVTGRPEWVAIKTGLLGSQSIAPIAGATIRHHTDDDADDDLMLAYEKSTIKDAPDVDEFETHLDADTERELYAHYGFDRTGATPETTYGTNYGKLRPDVDYRAARYDRQRGQWAPPGETVTTEQSGEVVSEATAVSEQVQKTAVPETVRLRKYQHTEMVPVTKEEIRVETVAEGETQTKRPR